MKKYCKPEFNVIKYTVKDKTLSPDGYKDGDVVNNPWGDMFESDDGNDAKFPF